MVNKEQIEKISKLLDEFYEVKLVLERMERINHNSVRKITIEDYDIYNGEVIYMVLNSICRFYRKKQEEIIDELDKLDFDYSSII